MHKFPRSADGAATRRLARAPDTSPSRGAHQEPQDADLPAYLTRLNAALAARGCAPLALADIAGGSAG